MNKKNITFTLILLMIIVLLLSSCGKKIEISGLDQVIPGEDKESTQLEEFCGDAICQDNENECTCEKDCGVCSNSIIDCKSRICDEDNRCILREVSDCCGNGKCELGEYDVCELDCIDCDDKKICTVDTFDYDVQKCKHTPLDNCCGNKVCEKGEACDSCFSDCDCQSDKTLDDFPLIFKGKDVAYVVGSEAPPTDVILLTDILTSTGLAAGSAQLDTDISYIEGKNILAIGYPCENQIIYDLLKTDEDCEDIIDSDEAIIKIIPTGEDTYAVIIAGNGKSEKEMAVEVLANYDDYNLDEDEITIDKDFLDEGSSSQSGSEDNTVTRTRGKLGSYPSIFLDEDNETELIIVISDEAKSADIAAAQDIKRFIENLFEDATDQDFNIPINDSEQIDDATDFDAIIIGDPYVNPEVNTLYNRHDFEEDHPTGEAIIKYYKSGNRVQIIVSALDSDDIKNAARVMVKPDDYNLQGETIKVTEDDEGNIIVEDIS